MGYERRAGYRARHNSSFPIAYIGCNGLQNFGKPKLLSQLENMTAFAGISVSLFVVVLAVFLLGGIVKGILGFGLPLITIGLLPFFIPVELAIVISAVVQPFTNVGQLITSGNPRQAVACTWPVILTLGPGVALGAWYLSGVSADGLLLIAGCAVVAFSLTNLTGFTISISPRRSMVAGLATGFVAGVIGALTAINGMIFIMYLVGLGVERRVFRSSIALLFIVSALFIASGYWAVGFLDMGRAMLALACVVPSFIGMWIGNAIGERMPNEGFRKAVLIALLIIGAGFVVRGIGFG